MLKRFLLLLVIMPVLAAFFGLALAALFLVAVGVSAFTLLLAVGIFMAAPLAVSAVVYIKYMSDA